MLELKVGKTYVDADGNSVRLLRKVIKHGKDISFFGEDGTEYNPKGEVKPYAAGLPFLDIKKEFKPLSFKREEPTVEGTLAEREGIYGSFEEHSCLASTLLDAMPLLIDKDPVYRNAMNMIVIKIARLITGRMSHADTWHDIAGYATLAEKHALKKDKK